LVAFSVIAGVAIVGMTLGAGAQEAPKYWVDGARPNPSATPDPSDPVSEQELAACVPYSADRADWHVCGDVSDDFTPPPKPYYDEQICSRALAWMDAMRASLEADHASDEMIAETWPPVDPASCEVHEGPLSADTGGLITFAKSDGSGRYVQIPLEHGLDEG
jgi:hypothetical protein